MNRAGVNEPDVKLVALPSAFQTDGEDDHGHAVSWRDITRVLFLSAAAGAIWFFRVARDPYVTGIGVTCTLIGVFPILHEAYENITQRRMTMELSMTIAIVAALAIGEFFTALNITLFVLVAEILEGLTVGKAAKRSSAWLISFRGLPPSANMENGKRWASTKYQLVMRSWFVPGRASQSMAKCFEVTLLLTKHRSRASPCLLKKGPVRPSMPEQ